MGWSFNELGRRADVTKSNLYRYFGSREEVLMHLLHEETEQFASRFADKTRNRSLSVEELCVAIAELYQGAPLLCELLSISASILEQNTDLESIRKIKLDSFEHSRIVAESIAGCTEGIDYENAARIAFVSGIIVMGLWPMANDDAPLRKLAKNKGLESLNLDFQRELTRTLEAQINGLTN